MNSVREGYKMTELGEIPSEWEVKKLKELLDVLKDGTHNPPKRTEEGIPLLSAENIFNGKINYGINEKCISEEDYELMHKNYNIEKDDILMTIVGTIGRVAVVKDNKKFTVQRSVAILRSNKKVNNLFLTQFLSSTICKKELDRKSNSTAQAGLYLGELGKINIIVPSINEQEKIASILLTVDEQIDNVDALIEKNKELKKGLMQTLLTKGIGHTKFKKTEIGEIPEEWDLKTFKDISKVSQGLQIAIEERYKEFKKGRLPYITIQYINDKLNSDNEYFIENFSESVVCKEDDILMTRTGNTGIVVTNEIGVFHNNFFRVDFRRDLLDKDFLVCFLNTNFIQNLIIRYAGTTTIPDLKHGDFYKLPIVIPPLDEQKEIALILSEVDRKIEEHKKKKQMLEELKKGLMQQLLTGRIRVI